MMGKICPPRRNRICRFRVIFSALVLGCVFFSYYILKSFPIDRFNELYVQKKTIHTRTTTKIYTSDNFSKKNFIFNVVNSHKNAEQKRKFDKEVISNVTKKKERTLINTAERFSSNKTKFSMNRTTVSSYLRRNTSAKHFKETGSSHSFKYTREIRHIGFLKVHKAGSSTMQNIFYRFGLKRNLTFVLPSNGNYISRNPFRSEYLLPAPDGLGYDILCNHAIYNKELFSTLLPNDAAYIAIIRDPLTLFVSAANYYRERFHMRYLMKVPKKHFLLNLIRNPRKYDRGTFSRTKNSMAKDFGFQEKHAHNPNLLSQYLEELRKDFSFVLVMEHMDESLVLMKRKLNWTLADIVYVPKNVHPHNFSLDSDKSDIYLFKKRNWLDYEVYQFFYNSYVEELAKEKASLGDEVSVFRKMLERVQAFCYSYRNTSKEILTVAETKYNERFYVTRLDCEYMMIDELSLLNVVRNKQVKRTGQRARLRGQFIAHRGLNWSDEDRIKMNNRRHRSREKLHDWRRMRMHPVDHQYGIRTVDDIEDYDDMQQYENWERRKGHMRNVIYKRNSWKDGYENENIAH